MLTPPSNAFTTAPQRNRRNELNFSLFLGTRRQETKKPSASASPSLKLSAAMEVFEGVEFVRLRSLEHGTYLHAAEDGRGVLLDALGASRAHHAAWAVQREQGGGGG